MISLRLVLLVTVLLCVPEAIHELWHVDEWMNGWTHRTFMAWADPCLQVGSLMCHSLVVLSGWLPVLWLVVAFWRTRRLVAGLVAMGDGS